MLPTREKPSRPPLLHRRRSSCCLSVYECVRLCVHVEELINGQDIVGGSKVEGLENKKERNKAFTLKLV